MGSMGEGGGIGGCTDTVCSRKNERSLPKIPILKACTKSEFT